MSVIVSLYLKIGLRNPKHTTVLLWVKKIGVYQLIKPKEKATDWILLLDESISIGQEKLLLIMGIRQSAINFTRPLQYQDLTPIRSMSRAKWKAEDISAIIGDIKNEIGEIIYIVSDCGINLKTAASLKNIDHIPDLSHWVAHILKGIYEKDIEFTAYTKQLAQMRFRLCCTKVAYIIPPKQRMDSRFMNIAVLAQWGGIALKLLNNNKKKTETEETSMIEKELLWISPYENFIKDLRKIMNVCNVILKILKHKGLNNDTIALCRKKLTGCKEGKLKMFNDKIEEYFTMIMNRAKVKTVLITTDIIESSFGKYKNYLSKNQMIGITDLALCIAAFTFRLENKAEIKKAMEQIEVRTVKDWGRINIGRTLLTKRKEVFKN